MEERSNIAKGKGGSWKKYRPVEPCFGSRQFVLGLDKKMPGVHIVFQLDQKYGFFTPRWRMNYAAMIDRIADVAYEAGLSVIIKAPDPVSDPVSVPGAARKRARSLELPFPDDRSNIRRKTSSM